MRFQRFKNILFKKSSRFFLIKIKQNLMGFSQGLELLTNFDGADPKRMVFIYFRELKT
jgi:hypothetical protein